MMRSRPAGALVGEVVTVSDAVPADAVPPDDMLDRANGAFWRGADPHEQLRQIEPLRLEDLGGLDDVTDDEWRDFLAAIRG